MNKYLLGHDVVWQNGESDRTAKQLLKNRLGEFIEISGGGREIRLRGCEIVFRIVNVDVDVEYRALNVHYGSNR